MLARLEGEVMLAALSTKVRAFEPTGRPVQRLNNVLRGLASLPLRIHPV
jgi:cytochrome P450